MRSKEKAGDQNWAYREFQNVTHQRSGSLRTGASGGKGFATFCTPMHGLRGEGGGGFLSLSSPLQGCQLDLTAMEILMDPRAGGDRTPRKCLWLGSGQGAVQGAAQMARVSLPMDGVQSLLK